MIFFDDGRISAAYDRWLTTTPADREHLPECNCPPCHQMHEQEGLIEEYATLHSVDYPCCVDALEMRQES